MYQCNLVMCVPQGIKQRQSKSLVHPLVDEAKSKDVVSTTPPRSPRSVRSLRIQSPSLSTKQDVSIATPATAIHCKMVKVRHCLLLRTRMKRNVWKSVMRIDISIVISRTVTVNNESMPCRKILGWSMMNFVSSFLETSLA